MAGANSHFSLIHVENSESNSDLHAAYSYA